MYPEFRNAFTVVFIVESELIHSIGLSDHFKLHPNLQTSLRRNVCRHYTNLNAFVTRAVRLAKKQLCFKRPRTPIDWSLRHSDNDSGI